MKKSMLLMLMLSIIGTSTLECAAKRKPKKDFGDEERASKQPRIMMQEDEPARKEEVQEQAEEKMSAHKEGSTNSEPHELFSIRGLTTIIDEYFEPTVMMSVNHEETIIKAGFIGSDESKFFTANFRAVCIWDTKSGRLLKNFPGGYNIEFDRDNIRLFMLRDDSFYCYSVANGALLNTIDQVDAYDISADKTKIALGFANHTIQIHDINTNELLLLLNLSFGVENKNEFTDVIFSPDARKMYVMYEDEDSINVYNAYNDAVLLYTLEGVHAYFSPDNSRIIVVGYSGQVDFFDVNNGKKIRQIPPLLWETSFVDNVNFNRDGTKVILLRVAKDPAVKTDEILILDVQSGKILLKIPIESEEGMRVCNAQFSPDGKSVVAIDHKTIRFWDARNGQLQQTLSSGGTFIRFSSDGSKMLTVDNNTATMWELAARLTPTKPVKTTEEKRAAEKKRLKQPAQIGALSLLLERANKIRARSDLNQLIAAKTIDRLDAIIEKLYTSSSISQETLTTDRRFIDDLEYRVDRAAALVQKIQDIQKQYHQFLTPKQKKLLANDLRLLTKSETTSDSIKRINGYAREVVRVAHRVQQLNESFALPEDPGKRLLMINLIHKLIKAGKTDQQILEQLHMQKQK